MYDSQLIEFKSLIWNIVENICICRSFGLIFATPAVMQFNYKMPAARNRSLLMLAGGIIASAVVVFSPSRVEADAFFTYGDAGQPLLQADFSDVSSGQVTMTLTGFDAADSLDALYFNFNPLLSASGLEFNLVSSSGSGLDNVSVQTGTDAFKVDGGGKFDIKFTFQNAPAAGTIVFDITGISDLDSADFEYLSTPTAGGSGPNDSSAIFSTSTGASFVVLDDEENIPNIPDGFETAILLGLGILGIALVKKTARCHCDR